jgi:hypothetical protein
MRNTYILVLSIFTWRVYSALYLHFMGLKCPLSLLHVFPMPSIFIRRVPSALSLNDGFLVPSLHVTGS